MKAIQWKAVALSCGITWGVYVLFIGWVATTGWGSGIVSGLGQFYIGYSASFIGGIIGGIWAFVDGFIGGAIFAWLYNAFASKK